MGQRLGEELACGCHNLANVLWHKVGTNVRRTFNKEQLFAGRSSRLDMGIFRHIVCIGGGVQLLVTTGQSASVVFPTLAG